MVPHNLCQDSKRSPYMGEFLMFYHFKRTTTTFAFLSLTICYASSTQADTFGSGANTFDIDFVTIGNPSNDPDTTGRPNPAGKVDYGYRMGQFEISEQMIDKANALGGLGITHYNFGANKPATSITWFEATKFVNWLNTSTGSLPTYKFDDDGNFQLWTPGDPGYNLNNLYRNSLATYFLPSVDEWYKAAYYNPAGVYYNYPTGSNGAPTPVASGILDRTAVCDQTLATGPADITLAGGLSPYGTMGQGGNAYEWEETDYDGVNDSISSLRTFRGGDFLNHVQNLWSMMRVGSSPSAGSGSTGFRVASIPEPSTLLLAALATVGLLVRRR